MNHVKIVFEPLHRFAAISIDGVRISQYSDLAMCESKDMHVCGVKLFQMLDDEINDKYQVQVEADEELVNMLAALSEQSDFCVSVQGTAVNSLFSVDEITTYAAQINAKYNLSVNGDYSLKVAGDATASLPDHMVVSDLEQADLVITANAPSTSMRGKTVVVLSDHYEIQNERGMNLVTIPAVSVVSFCRYVEMFVKKLPFIETTFEKARYATLSTVDKLTIESYQKQSPNYSLEFDCTESDVGQSVDYQLITIPNSLKGYYKLVVDKPALVSMTANTIRFLGEGTVTFSVLDKNGVEYEKKQVQIASHTLVTSIRIVPASSSIEVGKKSHVDAYLLPERAENASSLTWSSSNPDVLIVTSTGDLVALSAGTATITAACSSCESRISITVKPTLEKIVLSKSTLSISTGETQVIECNVVPADAAHGKIVWELSNDALGSINVGNNGKICTYTATSSSLAKGTLKCRVKGSDKNAACSIDVIPEFHPSGMITTAIVFSVIGLIASFLIPLVWMGGGGIGGFFADFFLPVAIIICLVGKSKYANEKVFSTLLTLDLIFSGVMLFIAMTCCNPMH